jgi:hypothetical protein
LAVAVAPAFAQAPPQGPSPTAGRIQTASGAVFILRGGVNVPAAAGQPVFESDGLKTGPDGRLGITLRDDTRLTLGPGSEIRLDRFAYAPADGRLGFAMRVIRGIATYVSGRIARLAPDAVRIETPTAIVGVRGTTLAIRVQG